MIPLPEEVGGFVLGPAESITQFSSSGAYEDEEGRQFNFVFTPDFGDYASLMGRMTDHRQVGIAVCGAYGDSYVACAAAAEDADLTIRPLARSEFTMEEFAALLEDFVDWYQAQA